jgi:hypothetical protein
MAYADFFDYFGQRHSVFVPIFELQWEQKMTTR